MTHIINRQQLINWLEDNAPTPSTKRAVRDGQVELLGLFNPIPSSSYPGFVIYVISSITEKGWYIGMRQQSKPPYNYHTWVIGEMLWKNWAGDKYENLLCQGDFPDKYKELKENEMVAINRSPKIY